MAARSLSAHLSALPTELHEAILQQTFTIHGGIRNGNTPATLHLLQVSKRTRAIHSTAYYGNGSVFRVAMTDLGGWLAPLADCDRSLIRELDVSCGGAAAIPQLRSLLGVLFAPFVGRGGQFLVKVDEVDTNVVNVSFF